ncbi:hypothetical protein LEMLEM_LOCUS15907 [Lemmus lemmus]
MPGDPKSHHCCTQLRSSDTGRVEARPAQLSGDFLHSRLHSSAIFPVWVQLKLLVSQLRWALPPEGFYHQGADAQPSQRECCPPGLKLPTVRGRQSREEEQGSRGQKSDTKKELMANPSRKTRLTVGSCCCGGGGLEG